MRAVIPRVSPRLQRCCEIAAPASNESLELPAGGADRLALQRATVRDAVVRGLGVTEFDDAAERSAAAPFVPAVRLASPETQPRSPNHGRLGFPRFVWRRGRGYLVAALTIGALAGCAFPSAQPLNESTVAAALQPPPPDAVRIAAAKLEHPLLKPLEIDGRGGFTPDEIAVITVVASPKLRALRDQRGVAEAQIVQAGILPNPQLGYSLDELHGNNAATLDSTLVNGRSIGLSWDVTSLLARHDNVAAARATSKSVDLSIAWQEWQLAQDARLRAYRLLSLQDRVPLARETEDDLAANVAVIWQARSAGQKTTADLTSATLAWTQAQADRFALEQQANADRVALNLALGQPADAPLQLKRGSAAAELTRDTLARGAPQLLNGLERRRLDLVALRLGYESEEATLRAAVKAQFPKLGLSFGRANDTSDVRTRSYGLTLDLPVFDRGQGQIAIAKATRQQLFDEYVARVAEARGEVTQALADATATRTQLQSVQESIPALEQLAKDTELAFRSNNVDILTYREARSSLASRRMEVSRLQQALLELELGIEIAAALPPDGGSVPPTISP